jgi:hypothetical protein
MQPDIIARCNSINLTTNITPRFFHCTASYVDENNVVHYYVFGGRMGSKHYNDMWHVTLPVDRLNDPTATFNSEVLNTSGTHPHAGRSYSMLYHPLRHSLVVYGGRNTDQMFSCNSELYELELNTMNWICTTPPQDNIKESPGGLRNHSAIFRNNYDSMVLFGGYKMLDWGLTPSCEMYEYTFSTGRWNKRTSLLAPLNKPLYVSQHIAAMVDNDTMIIFGGISLKDEGLNTIYYYKFSESLWYEIQIDFLPSGRYAHAGAYCNNRLFTVSGVGLSEFQDIYAFDTDTMKWSLASSFKHEDSCYGHAVSAVNFPRSENYFTYRSSITCNTNAESYLLVFGGEDMHYSTKNELKCYTVNLDRSKRLVEFEKITHQLPSQVQYRSDMLQLFSDQTSGDVRINSFLCHSFILDNYKFFAETKNNELVLSNNDIDDELLRFVLSYLYTSNPVEFHIKDMVGDNYILLIRLAHYAANYFKIPDLAQHCITYLKSLYSAATIDTIHKHIVRFIEKLGSDSVEYPVVQQMLTDIVKFASSRCILPLFTLPYTCLDLQIALPKQAKFISANMRANYQSIDARWLNNQLSDEFVVLKVRKSLESTETTTVVADRNILNHRCEYFSCLFNQTFEDSNDSELDFTTEENTVTSEEMSLILYWIYTSDIDIVNQSKSLLERLIVVADMLLLSDLVELLIMYSQRQTDIQ